MPILGDKCATSLSSSSTQQQSLADHLFGLDTYALIPGAKENMGSAPNLVAVRVTSRHSISVSVRRISSISTSMGQVRFDSIQARHGSFSRRVQFGMLSDRHGALFDRLQSVRYATLFDKACRFGSGLGPV